MEKKRNKSHFACLPLIILIILLQSFQLQGSTIPSLSGILSPGLYWGIDFLIVLLCSLLLTLLLQRWSVALTITSLISTVWSIANYFVIEFHGSPLFISEFRNAGTAMNVMGEYHYQINKLVVLLLFMGFVEIVGSALLYRLERNYPLFQKTVWFCRAGGMLLICVSLYVILYSPIKTSGSFVGWSWIPNANAYGFPMCAVDDVEKMLFPVKKPDGYSDYAVATMRGNADQAEKPVYSDFPDIILILNETFFDLEQYTQVAPDSEYLAPFYGIDHAVYGYAVEPGIGGGTNDSEFELLTSNSMKLLRTSSPFNYVDFKTVDNHCVAYLERLGYETAGMHCGAKGNYSRNAVYPEIGFDTVLLGADSFRNQNAYGNRFWLDEDNYRDAIEQYHAMGDGPRFLYLLTIQNHGGYEQNDNSYDLVHTGADFGELTDDVNEYLTSISMSATAFASLTDYFSKVDRPVMICMVGDHAPAFISELPPKREMTNEEEAIYQRLVPYVIWANYDVAFPEKPELATMTDLIPMVFETAKLPLSAYYQTILKLHDSWPVRTREGLCMDADGAIVCYDSKNPKFSALKNYYYLEYHSLIAGTDYQRDLFLPETAGQLRQQGDTGNG